MPPPVSTAQAGAGQGAALTMSPPAKATTLAFPNVSIPLLPPGHALPSSTADMEASTAVYFREGHTPYGKRHRSAITNEACAPAVSAVLEIVSAEEDDRAAVGDTDGGSALLGAPPSQLSASAAVEDAATARYLAELFNEPARCEQDVYRLVNVAHCRRVLAEEEEEFRRAVLLHPPRGSLLEGAEVATARAKRVDEFNSCLTVGQHRRYRGLVLEWLRHQPSPSAPPNSAEVLKVVQQEQRLFLEALRREAVSHVVQLSPDHHTTTYARLGSALTSFAQYRRVRHMRQRLVSFLDDAKTKESEGLLLLGSAPESSASAASDAAEDDRGRGNLAYGAMDEAQRDALQGATPLQLFQRRFPSLRVLQWHMVKLYNAQQNGVASPFPNPQIRSLTVAPSAGSGAAGVSPHNRSFEADNALKVSSAAAAHPPSVTVLHGSTSLLLASLPQHRLDDNGDESDAGDGGRVSDNHGSSDRTAPPAAPAFAAHLYVDAAAAASLTPLSTAALHAYVAHQLLPRLGWQVSKYQGKGGEASADGGSTDLVASVSLSISFEAMLKLFAAHVDTEEPRTSFRIPICARVTRRPESSRSDSVTPARGAYHAHVVVGAPVPNVAESRHSIQVAAAEYLIYRAAQSERPRSDAGNQPSTFTETGKAAPSAATVYLSRSTGVSRDIKARQATAQPMMDGASGNAMSTTAEGLLDPQEPPSEAAPPLVFHVAAPVAAAPSSAPENEPLQTASSVIIMAKMEHLNVTSAVRPHARSPSPKASPSAASSEFAVASLAETATPCRWLLEMLSPREMLQLDLLFACFPTATVLLHRVQFAEKAHRDEPAGQQGKKEAEQGCPCMEVLTVERLTFQSWCFSRRHLQKRPAESLITMPSPAEVLATHSWDLLYDTLAWLLDTTARRVAYALESEEGRGEVSAEAPTDAAGERYMYLIMSNHANLVNTSASTKLYTKRRPENAQESEDTTAVTCSYTESRFAVRYVVQDAAEVYPGYVPKVPISVEAANLRFLEKETPSCSDEDDDEADQTKEREKGASKVASRLYRDPHTWNAETIPFTFTRAPAPALSSARG
ncbi:hypothetical protein LSCM1_00974 [Leishmania martiniquensis]|uniref:Uncharacterized protein n=1 Tax=Leishmania martiniquensis TaxID=1580590 RepID=A0A836FPS0_9TRYP|nr:hypothetical protein LSCM1_00974 [Leishmania martiniquensis]